MKWYHDLGGFALYAFLLYLLLTLGGIEVLLVYAFAWLMWDSAKLSARVKVYTEGRWRK